VHRLISPTEAAARLSLSRTTFWRLKRKDSRLPEPIQVSPGRVAFLEEEIDAYIAARLAERERSRAGDAL
jgi:prophage regulatory protein